MTKPNVIVGHSEGHRPADRATPTEVGGEEQGHCVRASRQGTWLLSQSDGSRGRLRNHLRDRIGSQIVRAGPGELVVRPTSQLASVDPGGRRVGGPALIDWAAPATKMKPAGQVSGLAGSLGHWAHTWPTGSEPLGWGQTPALWISPSDSQTLHRQESRGPE